MATSGQNYQMVPVAISECSIRWPCDGHWVKKKEDLLGQCYNRNSGFAMWWPTHTQVFPAVWHQERSYNPSFLHSFWPLLCCAKGTGGIYSPSASPSKKSLFQRPSVHHHQTSREMSYFLERWIDLAAQRCLKFLPYKLNDTTHTDLPLGDEKYS